MAEDAASLPAGAQGAVFTPTDDDITPGRPTVKGYDFNKGIDYNKILESLGTTGFQGTNLAKAVEIIKEMRAWRLSDDPIAENEDEDYLDMKVRAEYKCKIFLGYTSNLVSSGLRETIRYLAQHKMVDVIVSTAGGIEEDFIKCLGNTYVGDFSFKGEMLRKRGLNRIGNLIIPNDNYCKFEEWLNPILDTMVEEQTTMGTLWTPSKMIHRLGKEINNEESIYYWCYKNNIPVFSPALTDGSIGDMIYFHSYRNGGLVLDIANDIRRINDEAINAKKTGMIILGGGVAKHHICNANLMRNGADFTVFVNTGQEFDGSDGGARPDEAISWGKIRLNGKYVKVYTEASIAFPLIVAQTFAQDTDTKNKENEKNHVVDT